METSGWSPSWRDMGSNLQSPRRIGDRPSLIVTRVSLRAAWRAAHQPVGVVHANLHRLYTNSFELTLMSITANQT